MKTRKSPPLYYIGTVPIKEKNQVMLTLHHVAYARLVHLSLSLELPVAQLCRMLMSPCQHCGNDKIEIKIPQISTNVCRGPHLKHFHKLAQTKNLSDGQDHAAGPPDEN